jgi:hypothetical protein
MADESKSTEASTIPAEVRKRMQIAQEAYSTSRQSELDDLRFLAGSPDNNWQWPADVLANRSGQNGQSLNARPTLTINCLPQHVLQVTNDQRQNAPSAKVIPADDKADVEVAEMLNGVIRHIEYMSDADVAYATAAFNQVTYGEGYFRILTEYYNDVSFEQDIRIARIRNSFSVYMDPMIQDPCGSDAQWCIITEQMTHDEFKKQYPKATDISALELGVGDDSLQNWITEKYVTIAEYFYYTDRKVTMCLFDDAGVQMPIEKGTAQYDVAIAKGLKPLKERPSVIKQVKWCKTNGYEVLEETDWAGRWIPVVRIIGNEFEVEGQLQISGIVRNAKDAQRMYNYWVSQEAEMLSLAPKAPFIGYVGQFEGQEEKWKSANVQNWPYLEVQPVVDDATGSVLPLPQRAAPPMPQSGILQAKLGAADDIKKSTGQYNPSLGQQSTETSGKAILAREHQADTGTYHYNDNLRKGIRFCARQLVDLIPKTYDTKRIARIIGEDGETDYVQIDPNQQTPFHEIRDQADNTLIARIYNPNIGRYDVVATTGPSYSSKRQEAAEAQSQLLQANPELWKVAGDLLVKNLDWPGADELAKRIKRTIPPQILGEGDEDSPEMAQAKQMIQGLQQENQQMQQMLQNVHKSIEAQDSWNKENENIIRAFDSETKRLQAFEAAMTPEQVQAIVTTTLQSILTSGDLQQSVTAQPEQPGVQ